MSKLIFPLLIIAAVLWFFWFGAYPVIEVNDFRVRDPADAVTLTNSQNVVTTLRYDTYEQPRGTDYQVPAGKTLYITHIEGSPAQGGGAERITIGYSTDTVDNSATPPTGAIVVFNITFEEASGAAHQDIWAPIPAGMYPYLNVDGAAAIQASGFLR